jgi:hypothetical protein
MNTLFLKLIDLRKKPSDQLHFSIKAEDRYGVINRLGSCMEEPLGKAAGAVMVCHGHSSLHC